MGGPGASVNAYVLSGVLCSRNVIKTTFGTRKHVHAKMTIFSKVRENRRNVHSKSKLYEMESVYARTVGLR